MGFQVNQAALAITPKHYAAKCPAKLHLNPTIEATGKGTVKYRFVDQLGHHSQTFQVKFDKSDVKFLDHVIEIDGKGKPKGLGFAAAQPQGRRAWPGGAERSDLTQGYFQLEVPSPHKKLSKHRRLFGEVLGPRRVAMTRSLLSVPDTVNLTGSGRGRAATALWPPRPCDRQRPARAPRFPTKLFVKITNQGKPPQRRPTSGPSAGSAARRLAAARWCRRSSLASRRSFWTELGGTIDGATQLYVRVDDPNRIPELNDGNNSFKVK